MSLQGARGPHTQSLAHLWEETGTQTHSGCLREWRPWVFFQPTADYLRSWRTEFIFKFLVPF